MPTRPKLLIGLSATMLAPILAISSCRKSEPAPPQGPPQPLTAKFQTVKPEPLTLTSSQPGRLEPFRLAEVRARVAGVITQRPYQEGQEVTAGTVLFQIDPAPFKVELDAAIASLELAEAALTLAQDKKERYASLVSSSAVSVRDMKEADSEAQQAAAQVKAAQASRDAAQLRLDYATVTSPIDGIARKAEVTEGALVGEGSATLLTMVEQIDPLYVNFTQPLAEVMALRQSLAEGKIQEIAPGEIKVQLILGDGSTYPHPGSLIFSDLAVDPATDTVQLRATVPNPGRELFPGMFVRVNTDLAVEKEAILIPRDALLRSPEGAIVMTLNADNQVVPTPVVAKAIHGHRWHILSGLSAGDRVIVENAAMSPVGTQVTPIAAE